MTKHTEVTVFCTKDAEGNWTGEVEPDHVYEVLDGTCVETTVTDEGVGAYEYCGQCGVHHSWEVSEVEGSADVDFTLDFQGYEFESDEEQEAAEEQVWASLDLPSVSTSDSDGDIEFSITWEPASAAGPSVTYEATI